MPKSYAALNFSASFLSGIQREIYMPLYHFTDSRNLESIRRYGLLSWKRLLARGMAHWPASSEDSRKLDARSNLEDYVRLCTRREHPMAARALYEGRIQDYVWLEVSEVVTRWKATLYSSDNAVAHRSIINNDPRTALESCSVQAEVLVLGGVNSKWITFPTTHPAVSDFDFDIPL
ncbi:DUF4433 domain-containing protein [Pseudomonas sp. o96-267]|uniref:DarT ssDNA thymidine ADP-ribosyltransferase family protein n=1 Tax=Pseudomonas sp. o96-267 TaxID=2479853 RepID=UPI000F799293|nr:DarT ssDNA thymidine ADP-ribosyltransferase family protein [Pseudomonas sp. o96-267]RRV29286.1 DUF4433 domain-containing protein [Pseudomonas sp. o96-267]